MVQQSQEQMGGDVTTGEAIEDERITLIFAWWDHDPRIVTEAAAAAAGAIVPAAQADAAAATAAATIVPGCPHNEGVMPILAATAAAAEHAIAYVAPVHIDGRNVGGMLERGTEGLHAQSEVVHSTVALGIKGLRLGPMISAPVLHTWDTAAAAAAFPIVPSAFMPRCSEASTSGTCKDAVAPIAAAAATTNKNAGTIASAAAVAANKDPAAASGGDIAVSPSVVAGQEVHNAHTQLHKTPAWVQQLQLRSVTSSQLLVKEDIAARAQQVVFEGNTNSSCNTIWRSARLQSSACVHTDSSSSRSNTTRPSSSCRNAGCIPLLPVTPAWERVANAMGGGHQGPGTAAKQLTEGISIAASPTQEIALTSGVPDEFSPGASGWPKGLNTGYGGELMEGEDTEAVAYSLDSNGSCAPLPCLRYFLRSAYEVRDAYVLPMPESFPYGCGSL
jgi:hypothetical protein